MNSFYRTKAIAGPHYRLSLAVKLCRIQPRREEVYQTQRDEVRGAGNQKWNLVAPTALQNMADDRRDQESAERAAHASNPHNGSKRAAGKHVGRERVEIRRKSLMRGRGKAD
jgi:hypothetical protein